MERVMTLGADHATVEQIYKSYFHCKSHLKYTIN